MEKIETVIQRCRSRIDMSLHPHVDDVLRLIQEIEAARQKTLPATTSQ